MPMRRRSSSAPRLSTPSGGEQSQLPRGVSGPDNSQLLDQLQMPEGPDLGFLDALEVTPEVEQAPEQAPPVLDTVTSPEHEESVELAVEEAIERAPAVEARPEELRQAPSPTPEQETPAVATSPEEAPVIDLSATMPGGKGSRPLTAAEIEHARAIYGDSIDYSKVRMTSDHWLSTGAPKCIGNTMHMRSDWGGSNFKENGELTANGLELMMHEIGHVWQYQNGGAAYIGDSLWSQFKGWVTGGSRNEAYDWKSAHEAKIPWEDWNPEQQATAVEDYHEAMEAMEAGWGGSSTQKKIELLQPYIDKVRAGEGAPQFSTPGAVAGGLGGAGIGALVGSLAGPVGTLIGAGIGGLIGGWLGGG